MSFFVRAAVLLGLLDATVIAQPWSANSAPPTLAPTRAPGWKPACIDGAMPYDNRPNQDCVSCIPQYTTEQLQTCTNLTATSMYTG